MTKKQPDFTKFVVKKAGKSENGQKISTELLKTLQPGWIYCHNRNFLKKQPIICRTPHNKMNS